MKKKVWLHIALVLMVTALLGLIACGKKMVEPEPQVSAPVEDDAQKRAEEAEQARLEEEARRKALEALIQKEQMAEREREEKMAALHEFLSDDVYFGYRRTTLDAQGKALLKRKAQWLKANPEVSIIIEGHADELKTRLKNLAMGKRRAGEVKSFLISEGVPRSQMAAISYGSERLATSERSRKARQKNWRVHFSIDTYKGLELP